MINWPAAIVTVAILLLISVMCLAFPLKVIKVMLNWPKFSTFNLVKEKDYPAEMLEQLRLINSDPGEYVHRFRHMVGLMYFLGVSAAIMLVIVLFFLFSPNPTAGIMFLMF